LLGCPPFPQKNQTKPQILLIIVILLDVALTLLFGLVPWVDNYCHLAGFVAGTALGFALIEPIDTTAFFRFPRRRDSCPRLVMALRALALLSVLSVFVLAPILAISTNGAEPVCTHWVCVALSCVEMPFWSEAKWWSCNENLECVGALGSLSFSGNGENDVVLFDCFGGREYKVSGSERGGLRRSGVR
jgi:hypothetical protein